MSDQPASIRELEVRLALGDAASARSAGVDYARVLSGAPTGAFIMAVEEQADLIVCWAIHAGCAASLALTSARQFREAAEAEWLRFSAAGAAGYGGRA